MRVFSSALLAFALVGCNDYNLQGQKPGPEGDPAIDVSPEVLSFNDVDLGESGTQNFTITSAGAVTLDVMDLRLETGGPFTLTLIDASLPLELAVGDSVDVAVTYTRSGDGETDYAIVESNDPALPEARVLLNGGDTSPMLVLEPGSWDAGSNPVGETQYGMIDVVSTGSAPVVVSDIQVVGEGFGGTFAETLPFTLDPGSRMSVDLTFTAPDIGTYTGELQVTATDANIGTVVAPLTGGGAGGPIAVCYANPEEVAANGESTTWYGADSYDTGGRSIIAWDWTLVSRPSGSSATMPSGGANRRFTPDLAGTYVAELVVENDLGLRSEPCTAQVEAIPDQDLWIEMFWDARDDDMDLHLVRPGGRIRSADDCNFANTNPDWGVRGDPIDDPSLDLDDIPGTGPENINISEPYETGAFEVWVDDYSGSTGDSPSSTNVTVNIYIGGALVYTDTKACARECGDMHFADIDWPSGSITAY